jgi:DNA-binding FadR family transcriptional regulator
MRSPPPWPTGRLDKKAYRVAQALVNRLLADGLVPGDRLPPQSALIEEYDVSLGTLREALSLLENQGVIRMKTGPGGGPVVAAIDSRPIAMNMGLLLQRSRSTFRQVVEARLELEPVIARVAARRIGPRDLSLLEASLERSSDSSGGAGAFVPHASGFHQIVAAATENPIFIATAQSLHRLTTPLNAFLPYDDERHREVQHAHEELLAAMRSHDGQLAQDVMTRDIEEFAAHVERSDPHMLEWPVTWEVAAADLPMDNSK